MDEGTQSFSPFHNQPESPKIYLPKPATSGLTLVIPSLKSLKAAQSTKNSKQRAASISISTPTYPDVDTQEKKPPRPIKLKPLKEVLAKLIAQIKKKDDYAFFLKPVDVANVQGYSDIIKRPMDFGTMTQKVNKGKYRSLEEFASDFKLVTSNAKIFNPPNTLYHTEADRIEAWGLEHISKASSTVIQYETDWNIDIEKDEDPLVNVDNDDDDVAATPMDVDNSSSLRERSVSVASQPQPGPSSRRGPRGPYKKQGQGAPAPTFSETLDPDGGLPGSKDGLGAFPPGSDWAKTMVALKLKGKKYKTKKERLRIEREGPPLLPDGSLDYTEMEDPFSVLSFFVPEPLSRPQLVPLYPPLYNPPPPPLPPQLASEPSTSQTPQTPARSTPVPTSASVPPPASASRQSVFPAATSIGPDHVPPDVPFLQQQQRPSGTANGKASSSTAAQPRRRHWTINRNASSRQKGKERDDELTQDGPVELPPWQMPREAHATDFGSFAALAGALAEEMKKRGISSTSLPNGVEKDKDKEGLDQEVSFDLIRSSVDCEAIVKEREEKGKQAVASVVTTGSREGAVLGSAYWTDQRAAEAEEYLRDVVYGGADGFAYVRSLAEFTDGRCYYVEDPSSSSVKPSPQTNVLGMPLSEWVVQNIVDPLTDGRHSLLRETALELARQQNSKPPIDPMKDPRDGTVASQVAASLHFSPYALVALSALLQIRIHKIDMGSLIKTPNELFLSEEEWAGKGLKEKRRLRLQKAKQEAEAAAKRAKAKVEGEPMELEEAEQTWAGVDASLGGKDRLNGRLEYEAEGPEELMEVLDYVANVIIELDCRNRVAREGGHIGSVGPDAEKKPTVATSAVNGFGTGLHGEKASGSGSSSVGGTADANGADVIMASDDDERDDHDKDEGADAAADDTSMTKDREQGQTQAMSQPTSRKVQAGVVGVGVGAGSIGGGAGDGGAMSEEDPGIRNLRLNLLALAKRAPLDTIARLPKDLVPEHIRHFVPTLGSSGWLAV
ncbi:unnamed protein product [Cyclocybe aegerita]|uniref:Bromo domain-containing protein n=1 Tax=Cyclocybe aegerita TaxID=1973307 RepID=A0A8S0XS14_CYCAE|nr:unnamed protein product [Cyclocybe aegerita]